jgi:hypothetical protein
MIQTLPLLSVTCDRVSGIIRCPDYIGRDDTQYESSGPGQDGGGFYGDLVAQLPDLRMRNRRENER